MQVFKTIFLGTILCGLSFASTSLCPGSAAQAVAVNSFPATNTPPFGCNAGAASFSNFLVTTGSLNNGVTAPGPGDVTVFATGSDTIDTIFFEAPGPGPTWVVPPDSGILDSTITFTARLTGKSLFFTGLSDLLFIGPNNQGGGSVTITERYCLGAMSLSSCPAGQSGTLTTVQNGFDIHTASVNFDQPFNRITVQADITVDNLGSRPFGLSQVPIELFVDPPAAGAPEPAAYLLIGSALAAIGVVRRRKRS